jgi:hypothetical protein
MKTRAKIGRDSFSRGLPCILWNKILLGEQGADHGERYKKAKGPSVQFPVGLLSSVVSEVSENRYVFGVIKKTIQTNYLRELYIS